LGKDWGSSPGSLPGSFSGRGFLHPSRRAKEAEELRRAKEAEERRRAKEAEERRLGEQVRVRGHTRIAEIPRSVFDAEKATHILWQDAQWLRRNADYSYAGLQYAHIVLEDIRAIIATAAYTGHHEQYALLQHTMIAIETIDLRQRLIDGGVEYEKAEELKSRIEEELAELQDSFVNADGTRKLVDDIDNLLSKIEEHYKKTDHNLKYHQEASYLINEVGILSGEVAVAVGANIPALAVGGELGRDLSKAAIIAAAAIPLVAIRHTAPALWRQPDLASSLRRAYEFIRWQVERLVYDLHKLRKRLAVTRGLPVDEIRSWLENIKRAAFSIQVAMYETLTLIALADRWVPPRKYITSGKQLLCNCSVIVNYCDSRTAALQRDLPSSFRTAIVRRDLLSIFTGYLRKWLQDNQSVNIPSPLALRKEAELSKVSRLAEAVGLGSFHRWKHSKWE